MSFFGEMKGDAIFDGRCRYELSRVWDPTRGLVTFIMFNPSRATEHRGDPTTIKCIGFTKRWGYGGFIIGNLFARIEPSAAKLCKIKDPVGVENDYHLERILKKSKIVVCAWGNRGSYMSREQQVLDLMVRLQIQPYCLKVTKTGAPYHPLYVGYDEVKTPRPFLVDEIRRFHSCSPTVKELIS
jgi:hypothetical protein